MKASRGASALARAASNFLPSSRFASLPLPPPASSTGAMIASILALAFSHSARSGRKITGSTIIMILSGSV